LFLLLTITAWILLIPSVATHLDEMHKFVGTIGCAENDEQCHKQWGQLGVYRVMFGSTLFFALMALIMIGVKSSMDFRSGFQNGMWFFKILILAGAVVGSFFIHNTFFIGWSWVALIGAIVFTVIQLILLVDFAHSWNESWVGKVENGSKRHAVGLLFAVVLMYIASFIATVMMYVYYTKRDGDDCSKNKFFISFNLILSVIITVLSIHPRVQEAVPTSGVLQAAVVSLYCTYLVWSAVSNSPDVCSDVTGTSTATIVIGAIFTFLAVAYASLRTGSASQLGRLGMSSSSEEKAVLLDEEIGLDDDDEDMPRRQRVVDDERDGVIYNWSFFHVIFIFASCYLMMVLTDWGTIKKGDEEATIEIGQGMTSVWMKVVSSWIAMVMYSWTLVAPILLPDRDFSSRY